MDDHHGGGCDWTFETNKLRRLRLRHVNSTSHPIETVETIIRIGSEESFLERWESQSIRPTTCPQTGHFVIYGIVLFPTDNRIAPIHRDGKR